MSSRADFRPPVRRDLERRAKVGLACFARCAAGQQIEELSRILAAVERGEEYIIARAGRPVAKIVPLSAPDTGAGPGKWAGRVTIAPDFTDETPELDALFIGREG